MKQNLFQNESEKRRIYIGKHDRDAGSECDIKELKFNGKRNENKKFELMVSGNGGINDSMESVARVPQAQRRLQILLHT